MEPIDRRTVFAAGLAAASLMPTASASAQQPVGSSAEAKLRELGIELPKLQAPVANFVNAARLGNVVYLAGQAVPMESLSRGEWEAMSLSKKPISMPGTSD